MNTTHPIRDKHDVRRLAEHCLEQNKLRNHALIVLGVHTALRIGDLLSLKWDDVYDFEKGCVFPHITITEAKTGKKKTIAINHAIVSALSRLAKQVALENHAVIENPRTGKAISRVQAYRIIRSAAEAVAIGRVSCHSLRKTFGYHAWKDGAPLAVIMEIYNHSSFAVTRRYLGVAQDDKNEVYLGLKLFE